MSRCSFGELCLAMSRGQCAQKIIRTAKWPWRIADSFRDGCFYTGEVVNWDKDGYFMRICYMTRAEAKKDMEEGKFTRV